MRYKMVIFDLDGTILNTIEDLCSACNAALDQFKLERIDVSKTMAYLGHGIKHLVYEASQHSKHIDLLLNEFKAYYSTHFNDATKPYQEIDELLKWCLKENLIVGVLTNKVEGIARALCEAHFPLVFSFIYGEVPNRKRKPDATFLLEVLKQYQISCSEVLYIGDSEVDIALCQNAGIDGLFVSYGFRKKESLLAHTNQIVDTPAGIKKFLMR